MSPLAGAEGRSVPVRIRIDSHGRRLTPGIGAKAEIEVSRKRASRFHSVDALRNEGAHFVYAVSAGKATAATS